MNKLRRQFRNRVLDLTLLLLIACCVARNANAVQIELQRTLKTDSAVNSVAFSPDGTLLASGTSNGIRLWDVRTGKLKSVWKWRKGRTERIVFSPDSQLLVSGGEDNLVRIWNMRTARVMRVLRGHSAPIIGLAFSPDGSTLASTSASEHEEDSSSGELKVWNVRTGKLKGTPYKGSGVYPVVFSPDGKTLVAATGGLWIDSALHFWNARTLKTHRVLELHGERGQPEVSAILFNRNTLIVVSQDDRSDTILRFFNMRNKRLTKIARDEDRFTRNVVLSPDNKFLAVVSDTNSLDQSRVNLRDARSGKVLQSAEERPKNVSSLAFSKDGLLAAASEDGTVGLWRVK